MADPVDTQNVFSRTVQVQRLQQNLQNQLLNDQGQFAEQMRKTADQRQGRVEGSDESVMQRTEDGHDENKGNGSGKKNGGRPGKDDPGDGNPPDPTRGHIIDVEI